MTLVELYLDAVVDSVLTGAVVLRLTLVVTMVVVEAGRVVVIDEVDTGVVVLYLDTVVEIVLTGAVLF